MPSCCVGFFFFFASTNIFLQYVPLRYNIDIFLHDNDLVLQESYDVQ